MKNPQDLCHVEYIVYRRQMRLIHRLALDKNQRPSEFLRSILDYVLSMQESMQEGMESHDQ